MATVTLYIGEHSGEQGEGDHEHHEHTDTIYPDLQTTHTTFVHILNSTLELFCILGTWVALPHNDIHKL